MSQTATSTQKFGVFIHNRYRHPKQEVYDRYGAMHIQRLRTDESGALTLDFGDDMQIGAYRQTHARYWLERR